MSSVEEKEEIEITPAMIEAGIEALSLFKPSEDSASQIVKEVFLAMSRISESQPS